MVVTQDQGVRYRDCYGRFTLYFNTVKTEISFSGVSIIRKYGSTFYIGLFSIKPVQIEISIFTFIFHSI